ncbi:hypothetical protein ABZ732_32580, partial [Streptomyces pseudogriseolus]
PSDCPHAEVPALNKQKGPVSKLTDPHARSRLEASHEELWARVSQRNARHAADPNSIYFAESDLLRYRTRFVPPEPDEAHLVYNGDPESVMEALNEVAQQSMG